MQLEGDGMSMRTFPQLVEADGNESVVFAFIVFESREHRDEVKAKPKLLPGGNPQIANIDGDAPLQTLLGEETAPQRMAVGVPTR